jgi:two-component system, chemotaxis family, chemotaxis protein CheY
MQAKNSKIQNQVQRKWGKKMIDVLVVDDSKFMAKSLREVLVELGFNVVGLAHDGIEGIAQFEALHPEVTLLDVTMPNMDGIDCLTRILEIDRGARVVMLSAIHDPSTIERCLSIGAASFLQKPIKKNSPSDLNRLSETLENAAGVT